ncbi:MAG: chemotaxis protein CheB [Halioglobus sp.]|nr:chemotaxis protein CheB [Halioglobus sp.]
MAALIPADSPPATPRSAATRIVGIGASAGGLAPLESFLGNTPAHSGMAYIVVQHLDPTHETVLSELLQRTTPMPVREARQNMRIEPDCVYVIAPNTELSVSHGTLQLETPVEPRGMQLPINVLFSSLAGALGERAIAVVLSGMGSDGTLGLQAVRAVGGLTVVQRPDTAQFDSMPKSAIAAECGDIVAPPEELPARILAYIAHVRDPNYPARDQEIDHEPLQTTFDLLLQRTRHDFSLYKRSTLNRRIERRMAIHAIATPEDYAEYLQANPQEIDLLFKELLIGVTSFFRDPAVWEHLATVALPELLAQRSELRRLRAWVVGCSTGEEAYSLAISFKEVIRQHSSFRDFSLQIFATDLSREAIDTARRGRYPAAIEAEVSTERLERFFTAHTGSYQINSDIRDMVLFAQQDVILDPPFTKLDMICCRNLLIYFDANLQRRLIPMFHYSLRRGGVLLLGTAETVGQHTRLFAPLESKLRLYRRQDSTLSGKTEFLLNSFPPLSKKAREQPMATTPPLSDNLQATADQVLLQVYAPAAVVINQDGDILYISGRTGKYLEPATGKANWNLHAMVRESLQIPISTALKKLAKEGETQHLHGLQVQLPGGGGQQVDITIQALAPPDSPRGTSMIVFHDIARTSADVARKKGKTTLASSHEHEIQQYRDEIQSLREEAHASKEELQSANEELQSTNEELQSTNEELTTSKEEMQSMNEELQTINAEMQSKLDDLALAQSDMRNLLNSIEIAILFLDQDLNVRRYTDRATKIINVRESDLGRPLSDLTSNLQYPDLHSDALETLRTLVFSEKQILATDGRWFTVRIMPYRRLDNVIDGVVITLLDITATKKLEQTLRQDSKS